MLITNALHPADLVPCTSKLCWFAGLLAGTFFVASSLLQSLGALFEKKKEQVKKST